MECLKNVVVCTQLTPSFRGPPGDELVLIEVRSHASELNTLEDVPCAHSPSEGPLSGLAGETNYRSALPPLAPAVSSDDASIHEPLPDLPWLTTVAAHGKARKESKVGCGVLD